MANFSTRLEFGHVPPSLLCDMHTTSQLIHPLGLAAAFSLCTTHPAEAVYGLGRAG